MNDNDKQPGSAIEISPAVVATIEQPTTERPGLKIGRYKLLEQIGEGGMGTVWVAEQSEPVKHRVALKLVKAGMDTRQVLSRFEAERQALALMDHPNIAKVHDGGMTDSGRPFFVMELVKGVPITDYCDGVRLSIGDRLKLFIPVCQAVQHAHQKGIIHRDLKPSNILVCLYDGVPVPKVIDFGLAKAISQPLTEHTLYTAHGLMVGTPLYMSPEQAEYNNLDVDTRTDIYSLGVILYELLTGVTPLEKHQIKNAAFQEILRLIKEVEPTKPSTKLSGSAALPSVAAQRGLEPAQLSRLIRGDLDWIVMKSLEKERSRRYETANGLARDIERYLHDEPVEASPPSASYRLRKLARKHRALLTTASTISALLVLGAAVSTWQAIRATRAEMAARASETIALQATEAERAAKKQALIAVAAEQKARQEAEVAASAEKEAKDSALAHEAETTAVLNFVESKIFAATRPEGISGGLGRDITLRQALEAARPFVDSSFTNQPLIEARLRMTMGTSLWWLGEVQASAEQYEAARALYTKHLGSGHRKTLASTEGLAYSYYALGRHSEAVTLREESLAMRKANFEPDHVDTLRCMNSLAVSYHTVGRDAEALKLNEDTLAVRKLKLGADHLDTLDSMHNLAMTYSKLGRNAEALKLHEENLATRQAMFGPNHVRTLASMQEVAENYYLLGRYSEALTLRENILSLRKAILGPDHLDTFVSMASVAQSYSLVGRYPEALKLNEQTLELRKAKLGANHPDTLASMAGLSQSYRLIGRYPEALKLREETLTRRKDKLGLDHRDTLASMNELAVSYRDAGRHPEAIKLHEETLAFNRIKHGPDHPGTLNSMSFLANSYSAAGRKAEALRLREETLPLCLAKLGPDHPHTLVCMNNLASSYSNLGRHAEALKLLQETLARRKDKFGADDFDTLASLQRLAACLLKLDRGAEAIPMIDECIVRAAGKADNPRVRIPDLIDLRLRHFERLRDPAGCLATTEIWDNLNRADAGSLYKAACIRAVTATVLHAANPSEPAAKETNVEADRAMHWLQKAVAAGYKDAAHLANNKDLDSLRNRDDFKQLLASLEAAQPK